LAAVQQDSFAQSRPANDVAEFSFSNTRNALVRRSQFRVVAAATLQTCNTTSDSFISVNPHFCKSALAGYTPRDFIALVEKHGIAYHEKKLGQLFCNGSSQQIIDMLLNECSRVGVDIRCGCHVASIDKPGEFVLQTDQGTLTSTSLVIATGGLSIKPLGATDFGYRIAEQFRPQDRKAASWSRTIHARACITQ
jgi:predicted flavoprotein YhiN